MKKHILMLALMVMGVASYVCAGEPTDVVKVNPVKHGNMIRGHVIEKGTEEHLPYVTVLIVETGKGTVTDENGHFIFKDLTEGTYTLRVQYLGYAMVQKQVTVS